MYHNYHGTIKQRIANGELIGYEYVDEYNKIKPCLLLYFNTFPYAKPIRDYRWPEYEELIKHVAQHTK